MSWSFQVIGKAGKVADKIDFELSRNKCAEPEESLRQRIGIALVEALKAYPPDFAVKVTASGSQYRPDLTKLDQVINSASVHLDPVYGFIE